MDTSVDAAEMNVCLNFCLVVNLILAVKQQMIPFFVRHKLDKTNANAVALQGDGVRSVTDLTFFFTFFLTSLFCPGGCLLAVATLNMTIIGVVHLLK